MAFGRVTGRFAPADRLLDASDFKRVLRRGRRRTCREFVVVTHRRSPLTRKDSVPEGNLDRLESETGSRRRLGITTSRKVGNAVVRNRFKRRTRAWFRQRRGELEPGTDLVVIARPEGAALEFTELDARLSRLLDLPPLEGSDRV